MVTGWILAGGCSSRMGRDKAQLQVGSQLLIDMVIERLRPLVQRVYVIGHRQNVERLRECSVDGVELDLAIGFGPVMGVFTGLMRTNTPLNIFVPCDMPLIEEDVLQQLLAACQGDVDVVAARHPAHGVQPFPLIAHRRVTRSIGTLLDATSCSVHDVLNWTPSLIIDVDDLRWRRSFTNVNTPSNYLELSNETTHAP